MKLKTQDKAGFKNTSKNRYSKRQFNINSESQNENRISRYTNPTRWGQDQIK